MSRVFIKSGEPLYKYAISFMESIWGTKKGIFPGCQPISIERQHFGILSKNDYVVCEKTDGTRLRKSKSVCIRKSCTRNVYMFT